MDAFESARLQRVKQKICAGWQECNRARGADQVRLDRQRLCFAFLLGMTRRCDAFAESARMIAIESLRDRLSEGHLL